MRIRKSLIIIFSFLSVCFSGCSKSLDANGYKITWKNSDGTVLCVQHDVQKGTVPSCPVSPAPSTSRYDQFVGWSPKLTLVNGNATYTAVYDNVNNPTRYNITYHLNGGINSYRNPRYYTFGDEIYLYNPTKAGYHFEGWYDVSNNRVTQIDTYSCREIELYAFWSLETYTIHVTSNISAFNIDRYDYFYSTGYYSITADDYAGYNFEGWYVNERLYTYDKTLTYYVDGDVELKAFYSRITSCDITIYSNDSAQTYYEHMYVDFGSSLYLEACNIPGYEFDHWEIDGNVYYDTSLYYSVFGNTTVLMCYTEAFIFTLNNYEYTVKSYKGTYTNVEIPSTYCGYPVTSIAEYAFSANSTLMNVLVPSSIRSIGSRAFQSCNNLMSVVFESGSQLISLGSYAFSNCTKLVEVDLSEATKLSALSDKTFYECSSLYIIELPSYLSSIGNYCFVGLSTTFTFTVPTSVNYVGYYGFYNCYNMTILIHSESQTNGWDPSWCVNCYNISYES